MNQSEEKSTELLSMEEITIIEGRHCKLIPAPDSDSSIIISMSPLRENVDINDFSNMDLYRFLAKTALTYFNSNQVTKLTFGKLVNKCSNIGPKCSVHMNFTAKEHVNGEIFYADLIHNAFSSYIKEDEINAEEVQVQIQGCSLLQKVDTPNPLGSSCMTCSTTSVIHPGPRDGYRILAGDKFESSNFMGYNLYKCLESLQSEFVWGRSKVKHTSDRLDMFKACANQALQHFNHKEQSEFRLVKVLNGFSVNLCYEIIVHLNFLAEWPEKFEESMLFFAEAVVPMLTSQTLGKWYPFLEEYIKVEGCCQLIKSDSRSVFGRVCEICISGVIHPGPNDGYDIAAGDHFQGCQFMETGNGIY